MGDAVTVEPVTPFRTSPTTRRSKVAADLSELSAAAAEVRDAAGALNEPVRVGASRGRDPDGARCSDAWWGLRSSSRSYWSCCYLAWVSRVTDGPGRAFRSRDATPWTVLASQAAATTSAP